MEKTICDTFLCKFVLWILVFPFLLFLYGNKIRAVNEMTCATHESHHRLLTISQYKTYYVLRIGAFAFTLVSSAFNVYYLLLVWKYVWWCYCCCFLPFFALFHSSALTVSFRFSFFYFHLCCPMKFDIYVYAQT